MDKEPMTYEQAMHELRKSQKGMRRLERRLMVAEGCIASALRNIRQGQNISAIMMLERAFEFRGSREEDALKRYRRHLLRPILKHKEE